MSVTRRSFVATLGAGGVGILAGPLVTWRGREAAYAFQGVSERRADRLLSSKPGMIRIDSNENPNGPGPRVFETIRQHLDQSNRYPVLGEDELVDVVRRAAAGESA